MAATTLQLISAALALVMLSFVVGVMMLVARVREMRTRRIHPQAVATSSKMAARLESTQAADNFRNLFETPVLFYALVAVALAIGPVPVWLSWCAWLYVALRVVHSIIHCSYNTVYHRLAVFSAGFVLVVAMWFVYVLRLAAMTAG